MVTRTRDIHAMQIHYIYDTMGRKTGVIIPIEEWNRTIETNRERRKQSPFHPESYRGLLKEIRHQLEEELARLRAEWEHR
jgi:hypothetical protein